MKGFSDNAFFLLFERIVSDGNPGLKLDHWTKYGVSWERVRHVFSGPSYGFTLESFLANKIGRNGWELLVMKEHWWAGRRGDVIKFQHWAKPMNGNRQDILKWFSENRKALDK